MNCYKYGSMRYVHIHIMNQTNPPITTTLHTKTATVTKIFDVGENPRLIQSIGSPKKSVTKNSIAKMSHGLSTIRFDGVAVASSMFGLGGMITSCTNVLCNDTTEANFMRHR